MLSIGSVKLYRPLPFLRAGLERRVNTGVWGTAAFPSVYSTQTRQAPYLPHSTGWMAGTLALLLIGTIGPLAGMDAAWLPLVAGIVTLLLTLGGCLRYAWLSALTGLPRVWGLPGRLSRWLYRGLIAWLHLVQPVARTVGRLRGLSQPEAVAPQHVMRHPWKMPMPSLRDAVTALRLVGRGGRQRSFWSGSWASHTTLLSELVGVLRAARPAPRVDVDEGWMPDQDLSLAVGRWGWLHVGILVEELPQGACLCRVRSRLRPSFNGTLRGMTLAGLGASGMAASMALYTPPVGVAVAGLATLGIAARTAWQTARLVAVLDRALTHVTSAAGFVRIPVQHEPEPLTPTAKTTASEMGR